MAIIGTALTAASSALPSLSGIGSTVANFMGGSAGGFSNFGLLNMGASLLGSVSNFLSGNEEAKALKRQQEEQWKQQMINVREQYRQLGDMERVANKEHHQQVQQNQISLLQQQAQVELLAGATGTGGGSVSAMLNDLSAQAGRNQAQLVDNFENQQQSFINQAKAIQTGGQMQMRSFNKPSAFGSLASGLGKAATAYVTGAQVGKGFKEAYFDSRTYSSGVGR